MKADTKKSTSVVRISRALDERLDALAAQTGRSKSYYASKAIEQYLEDAEDYLMAVAAYEESKGKRRYSLVEAEELLGVGGGIHTARDEGTAKTRGVRSRSSKKISQVAD